MRTLLLATALSLPALAGAQKSLLAPPSPVDARALGIGRYVPDAQATGLDGELRSWREGRGEKLTVLTLTSVTCPLCKRFGPALGRLEQEYAAKGVRFVFLNCSGSDDAESMQAQAKGYGWQGLYLNDAKLGLSAMLGARTTTELFVIDERNTLRYRGAVSDQYGVGFAREKPRRRFLAEALDALLAGEEVKLSATSAPGCVVELPKSSQPGDQAVTYSRDIARILQANCVECHRPGGVGPFRLDRYQDVSRRALMIETVIADGIMPPWFAAPAHPSPWANDRSLSKDEKARISAWIEAGKPEGDAAELPLPRSWPKDAWTIGEPDVVWQIPRPFQIKAEGVMRYQHAFVPTGIEEDRWVRAFQVLPTAPAVVHHVLVFVRPLEVMRDRRRAMREAFNESNGFFAAYVPGNDSVVYADGFAKKLPKDSVLLFQIHYTPNGTATQDQLKLGVVFADAAPKHIVRTSGIANTRIRIPAGAKRHPEQASARLPRDARLMSFMPHLHVRGAGFRYEIQRPGEERRTVLDIPRYDFNWQLRYRLRAELTLPAGTEIITTAWYDNSEDNLANPDPGREVRWGPQTFDEMMLGYVEYYLEEEDGGFPERLPRGSVPARQTAVQRLDTNGDGKIQRGEVPARFAGFFERLDRDGNGVLEGEELAPLRRMGRR